MNGIPFVLVDAAAAMPYACVCGNSRGPLVDTLMQRNPIGRVYWCAGCFLEMRRAWGDVDPSRELLERQLAERSLQLEHATADFGKAAGERDVAVSKLEEAENMIAPLRSERDQLHHDLVEVSRQVTDLRAGGRITREEIVEHVQAVAAAAPRRKVRS